MAAVPPPGSPRSTSPTLLSTSPLPDSSVSAIAQRSIVPAAQPSDLSPFIFDFPNTKTISEEMERKLDFFLGNPYLRIERDFKSQLQDPSVDSTVDTINDMLTNESHQWTPGQKTKIATDLTRITEKLTRARNLVNARPNELPRDRGEQIVKFPFSQEDEPGEVFEYDGPLRRAIHMGYITVEEAIQSQMITQKEVASGDLREIAKPPRHDLQNHLVKNMANTRAKTNNVYCCAIALVAIGLSVGISLQSYLFQPEKK